MQTNGGPIRFPTARPALDKRAVQGYAIGHIVVGIMNASAKFARRLAGLTLLLLLAVAAPLRANGHFSRPRSEKCRACGLESQPRAGDAGADAGPDEPVRRSYWDGDTTGLQYAQNLTSLALNNNTVTNFSGLTGLTNLLELYFNNAGLTDISFVTNFPKLQVAVLPVNSISDVTPLAGLTQLKKLPLNFNPLATAAPLATLTQLTNLDLGDTGIASARLPPACRTCNS